MSPAIVDALRILAFTAFLAIVTAINWRTLLIPHRVTVPATLVGIGLAAIPGGIELWSSLVAAAIGLVGFIVLEWAGHIINKKETLGGGTAWMMSMIGAFLGVAGLFLATIFGIVFATVIWMFIQSSGLTRFSSSPRGVPTGLPFALAAILAHFYGHDIVQWYMGFLTSPTQ